MIYEINGGSIDLTKIERVSAITNTCGNNEEYFFQYTMHGGGHLNSPYGTLEEIQNERKKLINAWKSVKGTWEPEPEKPYYPRSDIEKVCRYYDPTYDEIDDLSKVQFRGAAEKWLHCWQKANKDILNWEDGELKEAAIKGAKAAKLDNQDTPDDLEWVNDLSKEMKDFDEQMKDKDATD